MNVLIVGLGSIALKHINAIRLIDQSTTIYALRSTANAKEEDCIINLYSFDDLNTINFDFAIISNPTSEHIKTINSLLKYKCPLFIEKPLSNSIEINDTINEIKRLNLLTYIACNLRFMDSLRYIKKIINNDKKRINEINVYCGSFLPDWRPNKDYRNIYSTRNEMGGGVQFDLIHEIDYVYWIFGKPQKVTNVSRSVSSLKIESNDYANYILEYDEFCVGITLNYYRRDYKRTMEILFSDCTWLVDLKKNQIFTDGIEIFNSSQQINDTYFEQMKYFWQLVQNGATSSINPIEKAVEVLKIIL